MSDDMAIQRIGSTRDGLGESPLWDARMQRLYWIDALAGIIHGLDWPSGLREDHKLPAPLGSIALMQDGRLMVAMKHHFALYDVKTRDLQILAALSETHPDLRLNDGKADRQGRFVAGTMQGGLQEGEAPLGGLYRVEAGKAHLLQTGFRVTNGPCFSPDGQTLYITDSPTRRIMAYDYSDAGLANPRVFVNVDQWHSSADGATIDEEGYLWTALVRAGALARFAPSGLLDRIIPMPMRHPTSLTFGGPDLDRLFVTSIAQSTHLQDDSEAAGGLFMLEGLGVKGLAEPFIR